MTDAPPLVMLVLWALWVLQAVLSAVQVRKFARLFDRPPRKTYLDYRPTTAVIVPFKGIDRDLPGAIRALCQQAYARYELLLVVDSTSDPAYPLLQRELACYPHRRSTVLVAGPAGNRQGQKVHNQLFAIDHLQGRYGGPNSDPEVWVFADSDAVPGSDWLGDLIGPLVQEGRTGITTGYRWLVPVIDGPGIGRISIWSHLASIMNSSVACLYGHDAFNHAWGGSMAVRAELAKGGGLRGMLVGALCDDYQFTRMSRLLGLRVYFVPRCLVATPIAFDRSGLVNFAHRQYLLTRVYAPKLFLAALSITSLYVAGVVSATVWLLAGLIADSSSCSWWWPAAAIACAFSADQVRWAYRRRVIRGAFGPEIVASLHRTLRLERWSCPVWMTLHWLLMVRAMFGRTMRWRGITYRLLAPQHVERIHENGDKESAGINRSGVANERVVRERHS